jgi:hypothetical protein
MQQDAKKVQHFGQKYHRKKKFIYGRKITAQSGWMKPDEEAVINLVPDP